MTDQGIISVSQLNEYLKRKFDHDDFLSFVCIRGEISNYKLYPSGHHYFSLKDSDGALKCVMFKSNALRLRFRPENGMKVLAFGRVSVFPRDGAYQLYCEQMAPEGEGDLHVAFEQMKVRLQEAGLFDPKRKKKIPEYPEKIAIVTSSAGAAVHDMLRIIMTRYPLAKVLLLPVRVQGAEAPAEICGAIRYVNKYDIADVIIVGRGGGSMEDLWAFNDEKLAYVIYQSKIPVISAVGHEPDVTISDYVADLRAATPSNAAELVVPDQSELRERILSMNERIIQAMSKQIKLNRQRVDTLGCSRFLKRPNAFIDEKRLELDRNERQLIALMDRILGGKRQTFVAKAAAIDAMSPLKVLSRGYSVVKFAQHVLIDARHVRVGDNISVTLHCGQIDACVTEVRGESNE